MGTCRNYLLLVTDMLVLLQVLVLKGSIVEKYGGRVFSDFLAKCQMAAMLFLHNHLLGDSLQRMFRRLPPHQQIFYHVLASTLNTVGLGKRTWWGYKPIHSLLSFNGIFVFTVGPLLPITQLIYLYLNYTNLSFDIIGIIWSILPVSILVNINIRSTKMSSYKTLMENFMTKIHIRNYFTDHSNNMKQKILFIERVTRFTAYFLTFFFGLNWFFWINIPILHNIINKEQIFNKTKQLETCLYLWMPFDYGYNYENWIIIHLINVYVVGMGVIVMATLHCLNYIIIYHLIGHIQILKNTIRSSFVDDLSLSNEEVKNRLVRIMQHHSFILRIFKDAQFAFGINVAANYLHNLLSDSFILYQILNGGDIFSYAVMVAAYMGELIFMSFVIEEIRKQSEDLPEVVYSIPWESMTVSNQKIFILILSRVQIEMQFVSLGGLKAGVRPMISILKTTFSYYVMLKSSIESNKNK